MKCSNTFFYCTVFDQVSDKNVAGSDGLDVGIFLLSTHDIPTLVRFQFLPTVIGVFDDSSDYLDVARALRKRGRFRSSVDFKSLLNIRNV